MELGECIRRHGFRKWYERELLLAHAHLMLAFICGVGAFSAFETREAAWSGISLPAKGAIAFGCGLVGLWAMRRYFAVLDHAEVVAHQAECPRCKTYARFRLERSDDGAGALLVRCGACGEHWSIAG